MGKQVSNSLAKNQSKSKDYQKNKQTSHHHHQKENKQTPNLTLQTI